MGRPANLCDNLSFKKMVISCSMFAASHVQFLLLRKLYALILFVICSVPKEVCIHSLLTNYVNLLNMCHS